MTGQNWMNISYAGALGALMGAILCLLFALILYLLDAL